MSIARRKDQGRDETSGMCLVLVGPCIQEQTRQFQMSIARRKNQGRVTILSRLVLVGPRLQQQTCDLTRDLAMSL
eukprot:9363956-Heterocapsa_arctica.AAC.1